MLAVDGGYTYLGAVLAALLAALVFRRVYQLPWRSFDATFCVGLGYAIGRIGCFLAGDGDYGRPTSRPWAMSFPHGSVPTSLRVHPTMLYSSAWEFLIFFLLWRLSNHVRHPPLRAGTIFCVYVLSSSLGRFLVEFLSRNPVLALGLKEAQWVSLVLVAFATVLLIAIYLQKPGPEPDGS
jgi:phosphatidylglycerol:prolipoprotein diacylglycerol transferase